MGKLAGSHKRRLARILQCEDDSSSGLRRLTHVPRSGRHALPATALSRLRGSIESPCEYELKRTFMSSSVSLEPPRTAVVSARDPSVMRFERVALSRRITIAMSAYGNAPTTLIALRALFNSAEGDFELILVDDCSPDGGQTLRLFVQAATEHSNTRVFSFSRNLEYSGSLNCILSHARGDLVLFLSNDIFITPAYLRALLAAAEADPTHGIVRGCSNFVDGGVPTHNVAAPSLTTSADLFEFGEQIEREHGSATLYDHFLTGDAFLVTRRVLERIGTFDPMFYGYFADIDFGVRACCAGFRLVLARGALLTTSKTPTSGTSLPNNNRRRCSGALQECTRTGLGSNSNMGYPWRTAMRQFRSCAGTV